MSDKPKPAAWIDNSGHPHHLRYIQGAAEGRLYGPLQPLYTQAAVDAAVAAERERSAKLCETFPSYQARDCAAAIRQAPAGEKT